MEDTTLHKTSSGSMRAAHAPEQISYPYPVSSPLVLPAWEHYLTLHPVREYTRCILDRIHMGTGAALSLFGVQEVNYVQELTDPQSSQGLLHTPLWVLSY